MISSVIKDKLQDIHRTAYAFALSFRDDDLPEDAATMLQVADAVMVIAADHGLRELFLKDRKAQDYEREKHRQAAHASLA